MITTETNNRISEVHLMDCLIYMKDLPDKYFDLAVVDPPYGIGIDRALRKLEGTKQGRGAGKRTVFTQGAEYFDDCIPNAEYFENLFSVAKNVIVWGGNYMTDYLTPSKSWIVWNKQTNGHFADAELAWTNFDIPVRLLTYRWNGMLQQDMKNKEVRFHPTQKPVALYQWIYKNYLPEGGRVFDSHLGSGSNRIAADKAGNIDFYATEIDPDYFAAQEKRWKQYKSQLNLFQ